MLGLELLKRAIAAAVLIAAVPGQASETAGVSNAKFADVHGQHVLYMVQGAGKPLVLLHGGIDPDCFRSNLAELARGRQLITPHLREHGRTPGTERPLRSETVADDIAALIGQLNLGKADVMGDSLGASVALQTAIRHPEVVDRLVLVSGTIRQAGRLPSGGGRGLRAVGGQRRDVRPEHMVEFWKALGGGRRDAALDGSLRPASQLAIVPGTTHCMRPVEPMLSEIVEPFLTGR